MSVWWVEIGEVLEIDLRDFYLGRASWCFESS